MAGKLAKRRKPPGWGGLGLPTGKGSVRQQFVVTVADLEVLDRLAARLGFADRVEAARHCLVLQAAREREGRSSAALGLLAAGCRSKRGNSTRRKTGGGLKLVIWSQWVRPVDARNVLAIMRARHFRSRSEAFRYAVRACAAK